MSVTANITNIYTINILCFQNIEGKIKKALVMVRDSLKDVFPTIKVGE